VRYLLDTDICIYSIKRRPAPVLERLREVGPDAVAISVVTAMELRLGAEKSQFPEPTQLKLDRFLRPMRLIPFDEEAALECARLRAYLERRGRPIGPFDSLIAAQALALRLVLVTNKVREFERIPDLRLESWV